MRGCWVLGLHAAPKGLVENAKCVAGLVDGKLAAFARPEMAKAGNDLLGGSKLLVHLCLVLLFGTASVIVFDRRGTGDMLDEFLGEAGNLTKVIDTSISYLLVELIKLLRKRVISLIGGRCLIPTCVFARLALTLLVLCDDLVCFQDGLLLSSEVKEVLSLVQGVEEGDGDAQRKEDDNESRKD